MNKDLQRAKELVEEAFELVGERGLREIIMDLNRSQLSMAVAMLFTDVNWQQRIMETIENPQAGAVALLAKMLDKLLPSPQAVKVLTEEPDSLVVTYETPQQDTLGETK